MIGQSVSHYRVLQKIGQGGMGEVYLAEDTLLERRVALKFLAESLEHNPTARKRLLREAKAAAALDHPFICKIYETGEVNGKAFIAMEYVKGETLKDRLAQGPLSLKQTLKVASEIAEALEAAHRRNIVHRDLKPSNVMLTGEGHVKVMDFGLAKRLVVEAEEEDLSTGLTAEGATLGTLPYMSPEQVRGQAVDSRSDIFSFGLVLYEMLTGIAPFRKETQHETASAILNDTPAPLFRYVEDIPELVQHTVRKMLAKDPDGRYQLIHEVRTNLNQLLAEPPKSPAAPKKKIHRIPVLTSLAVLLILLIAGYAWWLSRAGQAEPIKSLAVLPLDNLMKDPERDYFVDGMTEAIIANLSRIGALKVISRTSAMRYKNSNKPPIPEIARELGVDAIVEGSVLWVGNRVRVTVQLINGETDQHVWAESYEGDLEDILALQSRIARAVAREINITVTSREATDLAGRPVPPEAHIDYLRGRHFWNQRTEASIEKAIQHFEEAIKKKSLRCASLCRPGLCPGPARLVSVRKIAIRGSESQRCSLDGSEAGRETGRSSRGAGLDPLRL